MGGDSRRYKKRASRGTRGDNEVKGGRRRRKEDGGRRTVGERGGKRRKKEEEGGGYFVKRRNIAGQPRASYHCPATSLLDPSLIDISLHSQNYTIPYLFSPIFLYNR